LGRNFSSPLSRVSTWVSPIKKSGWKGAPKKKTSEVSEHIKKDFKPSPDFAKKKGEIK